MVAQVEAVVGGLLLVVSLCMNLQSSSIAALLAALRTSIIGFGHRLSSRRTTHARMRTHHNLVHLNPSCTTSTVVPERRI